MLVGSQSSAASSVREPVKPSWPSSFIAPIFNLVFPHRNSMMPRSEEHTSELQSHSDLVCRLLLEKKNTKTSKLSLARISVSSSNLHTSSTIDFRENTRSSHFIR